MQSISNVKPVPYMHAHISLLKIMGEVIYTKPVNVQYIPYPNVQPASVSNVASVNILYLSAYMRGNHVWPLCPCCLDCLEDVQCSFNFDPLNFRHTSDEHTTAGHTITKE